MSSLQELPIQGINLRVIDDGVIFDLQGGQKFILGRSSYRDENELEELSDLEIDLSPYQAYEAGVSRQHAIIQLDDDGATVTDLGSANGTRLNGRTIPANIPQLLEYGDILTLGKFKLEILKWQTQGK